MQLYEVDQQYCQYLRSFDTHVPINSGIKEGRPFVGIVLSVNGMDYYAPLTSPKPKHMTMKNQIDFIKIDQGTLGAINLNNMIPVTKDMLVKKDYVIKPTDSKKDIDYKSLIAKQITWCNANKENICNKANNLYNKILNKTAHPSLAQRCCNFKLLEAKCIDYSQKKTVPSTIYSAKMQQTPQRRLSQLSIGYDKNKQSNTTSSVKSLQSTKKSR